MLFYQRYLRFMTTAGYSGTPLLKKLGIDNNTRLLLVNAPPNYYELTETDLSPQLCKKAEIPTLIHLFVVWHKDFEQQMKKIHLLIAKNKQMVIWVSWYKKSARKETDITEDVIRNYALKNQLVDIKVCAVSDEWSGLKLVVPKGLR